MSCDLDRDLLQRFHDDECPAAERELVLAHLESCPSCRSLVEDWSRVDGWARVLLDEETDGTVPTALVRSIEEALPPTLPEAQEHRGLSTGSLVLATLAFVAGVFTGRPLVESGTGWLSPRGETAKPRTTAAALPRDERSPSRKTASPARSEREALLHELSLLTETVAKEAQVLSESGKGNAVLRALTAADRMVRRREDRLSLAASRTTSGNFFERHGAFKAWALRLPPKSLEAHLPPGSRPGALLTLYYVNGRKAFERLDESLQVLAGLEGKEDGPSEDAPRLYEEDRLSRGSARRWLALQEDAARLLAAERARRAWGPGEVSLELDPPLPRRGETVNLSFTLADRHAELPFPGPRSASDAVPLLRRGDTWIWTSPETLCRESFAVFGHLERLFSIEVWLLPRTDAPPPLAAFRREARELDALLRLPRGLPASPSPLPRPRPRVDFEWIDPAGERSSLLFTVQLPAMWSATFELRPGSKVLLDVPAADGERTRSLVVPPVETNEPVHVDGLFTSPEGHRYRRSVVPRP